MKRNKRNFVKGIQNWDLSIRWDGDA
jgi:hypothetical protein